MADIQRRRDVKKKRNGVIIYFIIMLCFMMCMGKEREAFSSEANAETHFKWELNADSTVRITGLYGERAVTKVVIPEQIDGKKVTEISSDAFMNCSELERVEIPDTVKIIGERAFSGRPCLNYISVAEGNPYFSSVDGVLYSKNGSQLYAVPPAYQGLFVVQDGVTSVITDAFSGCINLEEVKISAGASFVENENRRDFYNFFRDCKNLRAIFVEEGHPEYKSVDGVLYSKDGKTLLIVPPVTGAVYTIPEEVERISTYAFWNCEKLEQIHLPSGLREIGAYAFAGCGSLKEMEIPEGVTDVGFLAFNRCTSLVSVTFPESIQRIGESVFAGCERMPTIKAGASEEEIKTAVRNGDEWMKTMVATSTDDFFWERNSSGDIIITGVKMDTSVVKCMIPEKIDGSDVVEIGADVFVPCFALQYLEIPSTVKIIHPRAMMYNSALTEIVVSEDNPFFVVKDNAMYNKEMTYLYCLEADHDGTYVMPETVVRMAQGAFTSCVGLEKIVFSEGICMSDNPSDDPLYQFCYFVSSYHLKEIHVPEKNPYYTSVDGVLYTKDKKTVLEVPSAYEAESFAVPVGVEKIAGYAFQNCSNLKDVFLPQGILQIGQYAFASCDSLQTVTISEGTKEIWMGAFQGCLSLTRVNLPASLVWIDTGVFEFCFQVKIQDAGGETEEIQTAVTNGTEWFRTQIKEPTGDDSAEQGKEDPVKEEQVLEPQSVLLIKQSQETGSTELFTYRITEDNELIITGLTEAAQADKKNRILTIPKNIGNYSVEGIADGAFAGVPLTSVSLPEGLLEIGRGAFYGCNLYEIVIPASVRYVGPRAFGANHGMQEIWVMEANPTYRAKNGILCDKKLTQVLQMPANFMGENFWVPSTVKYIGDYAFGNCRNLKSVYVDEKTVEIEKTAFWNTNATAKKETIREKNVVGGKTETVSYGFHNFAHVDAFCLSYHLNGNNSLSIKYDRLYGELILELPDWIELQYCTEISLKLKNEAGDLAIKFYDQGFNTVETYYQGKTEGIQNIFLKPNYKGRVSKIGFMACDDDLLDYSTFETIIYSLEFQFVYEEGRAVTYNIDDLTFRQSYNLDYEIMDDGSLFVRYDQLYAEIMFCFPEEIDMSKCSYVEARVESEAGKLAIKLYDKAFNEIDVHYGLKTMGVQNKVLNYSAEEKIAGIGFMTCDKSLTDYSQCVASIESVTFYMLE